MICCDTICWMPFHTGTFFLSFLFFYFLPTFFSSLCDAVLLRYIYRYFFIFFLFLPSFALPYCIFLLLPRLQGNQFLLCTVALAIMPLSFFPFPFFSFFFFSVRHPPPPPPPFGTDRLAGIEACMQSSYHGYFVVATTPIPVYYIIS